MLGTPIAKLIRNIDIRKGKICLQCGKYSHVKLINLTDKNETGGYIVPLHEECIDKFIEKLKNG